MVCSEMFKEHVLGGGPYGFGTDLLILGVLIVMAMMKIKVAVRRRRNFALN